MWTKPDDNPLEMDTNPIFFFFCLFFLVLIVPGTLLFPDTHGRQSQKTNTFTGKQMRLTRNQTEPRRLQAEGLVALVPPPTPLPFSPVTLTVLTGLVQVDKIVVIIVC